MLKLTILSLFFWGILISIFNKSHATPRPIVDRQRDNVRNLAPFLDPQNDVHVRAYMSAGKKDRVNIQYYVNQGLLPPLDAASPDAAVNNPPLQDCAEDQQKLSETQQALKKAYLQRDAEKTTSLAEINALKEKIRSLEAKMEDQEKQIEHLSVFRTLYQTTQETQPKTESGETGNDWEDIPEPSIGSFKSPPLSPRHSPFLDIGEEDF